MSYTLKQRVKVKGTTYTGTIVKRKSLLTSLFGFLPRYEVSIDVKNTFVKGSRNASVMPYKGRDLEKLTE